MGAAEAYRANGEAPGTYLETPFLQKSDLRRLSNRPSVSEADANAVSLNNFQSPPVVCKHSPKSGTDNSYPAHVNKTMKSMAIFSESRSCSLSWWDRDTAHVSSRSHRKGQCMR